MLRDVIPLPSVLGGSRLVLYVSSMNDVNNDIFGGDLSPEVY